MFSEKAKTYWADDAFGRLDDAIFLENFLIERIKERKAADLSKSFVLNLDAGWGRGKSFFLSRLQKSLEAEGYLVANVNAWRDDYADDPTIAVMAAIDRCVAPYLKGPERTIWKSAKANGMAVAIAAAKGGLKRLSEKAIGDAVEEIADILDSDVFEDIEGAINEGAAKILDKTAEALMKQFSNTQKSIDSFKENLSRLLKSLASHKKPPKLPLFVLVDEVDRCRPTYAISLLERVKHLFEIDDVVFVIATDTDQLRHSIRAVYGQDFNAEKYLTRFFDRTYRFEEPSKKALVNALLKRNPFDPRKISLPPDCTIEEYIYQGFDYFALPSRECEQCFDILRTVATAWNIAYPLELCVLFPIVVAHHQGINLNAPDFTSKLQQLSLRHGGGNAPWSVKFSGARTFRHYHPPTATNALDLCDEFRQLAKQAFSDILGEEPSHSTSADRLWILGRFEEEVNFLKKIERGQPSAFSMLNNLPKLVHSAGRILPM